MGIVAIGAPIALIAFLVSRFSRRKAVQDTGNAIFFLVAIVCITVGLLKGGL